MKTFLSLAFLILSFHSFAQRINSDCSDKNNGLVYFQDDLDQILLQNMKRNDPDHYYYSSLIKKDSFQYFFGKLMTVWNAQLPVRDTIFGVLKIHAAMKMPMRNSNIMADSSLSWMVNLKKRAAVSGHKQIDEIIREFGMDYAYNSWFGNQGWVYFYADRNVNGVGLSYHFELLQGVNSAFNLTESGGSNRDIRITRLNDSTDEIIFSYGWEDCPAGCVFWVNWTFHVYNDCTLDYLGPSGDTAIFKVDIANTSRLDLISAYPNPFNASIALKGLTEEASYRIYDYKGSLVLSGITDDYRINEMENIPPGLYTLQIQAGSLSTNIIISKL